MATNTNSNQSSSSNTNPNISLDSNLNSNRGFLPNDAFYNQLNAGEYYGIPQQDGCTNQGCVPNTVNQERFNIPSISEIAAYNRATIYDQNQQDAQNTQSAMPAQQNNAASGTNMAVNQGIPDTPATVLNYGATIEEGLQNDMGIGITDVQNPYPITAESLQYLNGFIRTQIGRRVTIDFLVGSNTIVSKSGFLLGVASNYILINELDTNDITTCDFYNIKFIRFYY